MKNFSELTKEQLIIELAPLFDLACQMILAGTLKRTVIRHFTNRGLSYAAAENIIEVGEFYAQQFLANKAK